MIDTTGEMMRTKTLISSVRMQPFTLLMVAGLIYTELLHGQPAGLVQFEVASVKLNKSNDRRLQRQFKAFPASGRLVITGMTVLSVIQRAYGLQQFELVHDNNPVLNQRIDIEAKAEGPASATQLQRMLQPLLAERFKLAVHREPRE